MESAPQSDSGALDELVAQALEALEADGESGLERLLTKHPQLAAKLRARINALRAAGLLDAPGDAPPERLGPFKLVRPLGQGGMGIVYLAREETLGRDVALKVIRPEQLYFPGARKRFRREVEIVASLQHPGIVPIHTVGEADGVPYFAMDLLAGASLAETLARLEAREVATLSGRDLAPPGAEASYLFEGSWEEACVRVVSQVALALDYAHQRGVVHRDVKPSNVLITAQAPCRAVLLDFGLAASKSAAELTRTGTLMGSLKYMAPEQARGESEAIGPRSDVYSLGATLYELLTLRSAVEGESETELLVALQSGERTPLRAANPRVSWELETVCLTALEHDPERRYATAADFARDLNAVLDKLPIQARRASWARRTALFVRRNPTRAAALALGFVLVVGGPALFAWQERRAAGVVAAQRDRAVRNAARARNAVDSMLTRVAELDLRFVPQAESVRRGILEDAVRLLEESVAEPGADASTRLEAARARARLGYLLNELGRASESAAEYGRAHEALRLLRDDPTTHAALGEADSRALEAELAQAQISQADMLLNAGQGEAALARLDDVHKQWSGPDASVEQSAWALRAEMVRARALVTTGKPEPALAAMEDNARAAEALLAREGVGRQARVYAFGAFNELGISLLKWRVDTRKPGEADEDLARAEQVIARAIELGEELVRERPDDPATKQQLAASRNNFAGALRRRGDYQNANAVYELAREEVAALVREHPASLKYQLELATIENQIGLSHDYQSQYEQSEPHYQRAVELLENLTRSAPHDAQLWHFLGLSRENLGAPALQRGDVERAVSLLRQGVTAIERALELAPENAEYLSALHTRCMRLMMTQLDAGDLRGAVDSAQLAPRIAPRAWRSHTNAAVVLGRVLAKARESAELSDEEREWFVDECPKRAVALMRLALDAGLPGTRDLRKLKDLAPLFGTRPFETFADELLGQPSTDG